MANLPCEEGVMRSAATAPARTRGGVWVLAATILGSSMVFIDGTVVNVALPALQSALNATATDVQWVVEAYALFLAAVLVVAISMTRVPESRDDEMVRRLDGWGAALATIGLCGITFGLIEAGRGGKRALLAGVIGVLALGCFFVAESRSSAPMLPLDLFRSRSFSGAILMTLFLYV